MNAKSSSAKINAPTAMVLKFFNGFWYFVLLFAVALIAIVFMRWELHAHNWVTLAMYFGAPVLLIVMSVVMLKVVGRTQRLHFSLLLIAIMFPVYLIETYLAFTNDADTRAIEIKNVASNFPVDKRQHRIQVIRDMRNEGHRAYPAIFSAHLLKKSEKNYRHSIMKVGDQEVLPLGGVASVPTVYNRESGQWVVYESDKYGFRNPPEVWDQENFHLAIIGDSFAHGAGLMEGEDIGSHLRTHFPASVNLGKSGNGPLTVFATLKEYCTKLKPRFVVYLYFEGNDLHDLNREKEVPLLLRYLDENSWSQKLYEQQNIINTLLQDFGEEQIKKNYVDFQLARGKYYVDSQLTRVRQVLTLSNLRGRIGLDIAGKRKRRKDQPDLVLFETVLRRTSEEVKTWGGTFIVGYLPAWKRYKNPDYHMYRKEVLDIIKKNEIPVVDLHPVFQDQPDVFSLFHFGLNGHYNKIGAQIVAEEVRKSLQSLSR